MKSKTDSNSGLAGVAVDAPVRAFFGSISIEYEEPNPTTYTHVEVRTASIDGAWTETRKFASGDANYDYHCAMFWLEKAGCQTVMGSSSCVHFAMDGGTIDIEVPGLKERLREYLRSISANDKVSGRPPHGTHKEE